MSRLLCDIKMFCAPFACVRGRQNRLHLSQRDTTEKSECKTLISPDPDEGSLPSQQETPRSQDSHWFSSLEQNTPHLRLLHRAWPRTQGSAPAAVTVCMCVLYRWLVCLCMSDRMQRREEGAWLPSGRCGWRSHEREPPSGRKCL